MCSKSEYGAVYLYCEILSLYLCVLLRAKRYSAMHSNAHKAPTKLNQRNLAIHNLLLAKNEHTRSTESLAVQHDTATSDSDSLGFKRNDRIRQAIVAGEQQRMELTEENLARHDSTIGRTKCAGLKADNLA